MKKGKQLKINKPHGISVSVGFFSRFFLPVVLFITFLFQNVLFNLFSLFLSSGYFIGSTEEKKGQKQKQGCRKKVYNEKGKELPQN